MSIESMSANHAAAKGGSAVPGKGKGAAADGSAGGFDFLALLSAADDALVPSVDVAAGVVAPAPVDGVLPALEEEPSRELDARVLVDWMQGLPVPVVEPEHEAGGVVRVEIGVVEGSSFANVAVPVAPALPAAELAPPAAGGGMVQATWGPPAQAVVHEDGGAVVTGARKAAKPSATASLQDTREAPVLASSHTSEVMVPKPLERLMAVQVDAVQVMGALAKEVSLATVQVAMGERRLAEPVSGGKAAPTDITYLPAPALSAPMGADGVVAMQSAAPLDAYVAEQVTYWIAQDVQNAEMTLEDMGFSPVQVSISMQGNEAQVAFRTDEVHARDAIEKTSQHLKDALERQGLALTGMSVGTSDSGGSSGQGRRSRQEGRPAVVPALAPVQAVGLMRPSAVQGRALDLFV